MNWVFYLKTTETCNLNCRHCFTSGSKGAKVFWDIKRVIDWLKRFREQVGGAHTAHADFHGGEPFLVPVEQMHEVHKACSGLWDNFTWGVTSNLVFKLTPEIVDFIKGPLNGRVATSWDPNIRFANPRQYDLWRSNVKALQEADVDVKLFVSLTTGTLNLEPIDLLEWVRDLGVKELALERLTLNGNARLHPDIFPRNTELDAWFMRLHVQSEQAGARTWFQNEFLETIYDKFENNFIGGGTFCRNCEQRLFTLNADGTIAGCPNSAPEQHFGHLSDDIPSLLSNQVRLENISCEVARNPTCYSCDVFDRCGGDCHQLEWQDGTCAAPKTLLRALKKPTRVIPVFPA